MLYIILLLFALKVANCQRLLAGHIHWRPDSDPSKKQILYTYRLSWSKGSFPCPRPTCPDPKRFRSVPVVHSFLHRFQNWTWQCRTGCSKGGSVVVSQLTTLVLTDVAELKEDKWESGEGVFTQSLNNVSSPVIELSLVDANGTSHLTTMINITVRADTGRPNVSPVVGFLPIYRVPLGCTKTIKLYPFDGDGDVVRCQWENATLSNSVLLQEEDCTLVVNASSSFVSGDQFVVRLIAEDYLSQPSVSTRLSSLMQFSRVPVEFNIRIGDPATSPPGAVCNSGPQFKESGTIGDGDVESDHLLPIPNAHLPFMVSNENDSIITFAPRRILFDDKLINNSRQALGKWNIQDDQKGIHVLCAAIYTPNGFPGSSRCTFLLIGDVNDCNNVSVCNLNQSRCVNLWHTFKCETRKRTTLGGSTTIPSKRDSEKSRLWSVGLPVGVTAFMLLLALVVAMCVRSRIGSKIHNSARGPKLSTASTQKILVTPR